VRTFSRLGIAILICAGVPLSSCKKSTPTDSETEAASSGNTTVTGFVTREHGYLDTAVGRKHMVSMAARIGLKRLFVDVWSRGCTLFKSEVMKKYGGPEKCPESEGDPLSDLMRYGKQFNIEIVPWFEWGNILPSKSVLWNRNKTRGWSGFEESFHTVPAIRVNPYKGDFDDFFAALLKESVSRYGAKEIHICDNFAPHTKYGPATAIKGPQAFTAFVNKVTLPARNAGAKFSLSSQRQQNSLQTFSIDWSRWLKSGIVSWVYPQLYHVGETKSDQFIKEAKSERAAGAIGVALYTGPSVDKWTLEGAGRSVKRARSLGLESAIFDFNSLLFEQKASTNAHVEKISSALGTRMRATITSNGTQPKTEEKLVAPPPPVLPPPPPVLPPPEVLPMPAGNEDTVVPNPVVSPSPATAPEATSNPVIKTRLCEYMKITGAPANGAPAFMSSAKGQAADFVVNEQLVYRHLTQIGEGGDVMMYITIYDGTGVTRVRWVEAKYLVERRPEELTCAP
jgi:uncharacterized lipoprotein YddW (UPF0748 family)